MLSSGVTIAAAWEAVKRHESRGDNQAIGDDGRAGGAGQMWWTYRKTWWPSWAWPLLEQLDYLAFRRHVLHELNASPGLTLREFYETHYNPQGKASDLTTEKLIVS